MSINNQLLNRCAIWRNGFLPKGSESDFLGCCNKQLVDAYIRLTRIIEKYACKESCLHFVFWYHVSSLNLQCVIDEVIT